MFYTVKASQGDGRPLCLANGLTWTEAMDLASEYSSRGFAAEIFEHEEAGPKTPVWSF